MKINGKPDGSGGGVINSLSVTSNGIYMPVAGVDGFAPVDVNVEPVTSAFSTSVNGVFTPVEGVDGFSQVTVSVPGPVTASLSVSINGTYTPGEGVDGYSQVTVEVPQSVTGFTEKDITERTFNLVNINNSASFVSSYAFIYNNNIETVNLSECTSIGNLAFSGCTSLEQVSIPKCKNIGDFAFSGCTSLSQINLHECESVVGGGVFSGCTSLEHVSLPKCSYIANIVFSGCTSLSQINLPECEKIGSSVFRGCTSLSQISLPKCKNIGGGAFNNCTSLSQISLPECESVGGGAFQNCTSLDSLTLCTEVYWTIPYSVNCLSNTSIINGTGSIYVRSDTYNNWITSTGWSSLADRFVSINYSIPALSFSDGLVYGETYTIKSNFNTFLSIASNSIIEVNLPECRYVGSNAFWGCTSLSQANLPKCSHIGTTAFYYNGVSLTLILGYSSVVVADGQMFDGQQISKTSIYVPASLVDTYKSDPIWNWYSNIIFPISE